MKNIPAFQRARSWFPPQTVSEKSRAIMSWLAATSCSLKRLFYLIEPIAGSTALAVKRLKFHC